MAIYEYEHPDTGDIFEIMRPMSESDEPFFAPDGVECKRVMSSFHGGKGDKEVFEVDPHYVKSKKPKYVRFRDGHREKYDPTKHC